MSPSSKTYQRGFSMAELLVAMAIFIVLMSGVAALYTGALRTVQQGYAAMDNFERARVLMGRLEEDLKGAFTARQHNQSYQFFGRPEGFMFVGVLPSGRLGRVTYVRNPNVERKTFDTSLYLRWDYVHQRMERQTRAWASDNGFDPNTTWNTVQGQFLASYPIPSTVDALVEFNLSVATQSILRYVEPGVDDLSTFDLSNIRQATNSVLNWPIFDPANPFFDEPNGGGNTVAEDGFSQNLYVNMLLALNPQAWSGSNQYDLRNVIYQAQFSDTIGDALNGGPNNQPDSADLKTIQQATIAPLIEAKQREIWLRLLADDPSTFLPSFWNDPGTAANPANDPRPKREDYVITTDVLAFARLRTADNGQLIDQLLPINDGVGKPRLFLDAFDIEGVFDYGDADANFDRDFNGLSRVNGYEDYMFTKFPTVEDLGAFDAELTAFFTLVQAAGGTAGNPLTPRIPALVRPGLWFVTEKPSASAADFVRWFTQMVEVPSGSSRDLPVQFTPNDDNQA